MRPILQGGSRTHGFGGHVMLSNRSRGYRGGRGGPRWGRLLPSALVIAVVLGGCGYGAWWAWGAVFGRPARLALAASLPDARMRLAAAAPATFTLDATGSLEATLVAPGRYVLTATRKGFAPYRRSLKLGNGERSDVRVALVPLPTALELDVRPASAAFVIQASDGQRLTGTGSFGGVVPAGQTTITVTARGCRATVKSLFLDAPLRFSAWLDPKGQIVRKVAVFKAVPAPKGLAITPDGREVWVTALVTQPSIGIFEASTGRRLGGVSTGRRDGAVEIIFDRAGTRAYASQMQTARVFEIDVRRRKVLRTFDCRSTWTKMLALSPDEKRLYAANWSGDDISEIDLVTGKLVRRMPTVDTPRGLWPTADGARLFVAGFGENSHKGRLAVIDLLSGESKTFFSKGRAMRHMVADERTGRLFTSDLGSNCVWVTDMTTLATRKFCDTENKPNTIDISPDGRVLFVSNRGANNPSSYNLRGPEWGTILLIDTKTGKPLDAIIGGNQCTALDVSGDGRTLVFSDFLDGTCRVYEVPPLPVLLDGHGGRYRAHLREIRKDGSTFRLQRSGGRD